MTETTTVTASALADMLDGRDFYQGGERSCIDDAVSTFALARANGLVVIYPEDTEGGFRIRGAMDDQEVASTRDPEDSVIYLHRAGVLANDCDESSACPNWEILQDLVGTHLTMLTTEVESVDGEDEEHDGYDQVSVHVADTTPHATFDILDPDEDDAVVMARGVVISVSDLKPFPTIGGGDPAVSDAPVATDEVTKELVRAAMSWLVEGVDGDTAMAEIDPKVWAAIKGRHL